MMFLVSEWVTIIFLQLSIRYPWNIVEMKKKNKCIYISEVPRPAPSSLSDGPWHNCDIGPSMHGSIYSCFGGPPEVKGPGTNCAICPPPHLGVFALKHYSITTYEQHSYNIRTTWLQHSCNTVLNYLKSRILEGWEEQYRTILLTL